VSDLYIPTIGLPILLEEICIDRSWDYINRSQTHECWNWGWGHAIPRKGIHKGDFRCSVGRQQKKDVGLCQSVPCMYCKHCRMSGVLEERPVILVANKTDLVRKRVVKTPGIRCRLFFSSEKDNVTRIHTAWDRERLLCYMDRKRLDLLRWAQSYILHIYMTEETSHKKLTTLIFK
jgi:hypothetical protein